MQIFWKSILCHFRIKKLSYFSSITSYVFDFLKATSSARGGGLLITNNKVSGLKNSLFAGKYLDDVVFTKNTVSSVTSMPSELMKVTNSNDVIIVGNTLPSDASVTTPVNSTNTTNLISVSNSWDE